MKVWKGNIKGNPSIGLFIFLTDDFGLIGFDIEDKIVKRLEEIFEVPFYKVSIHGTNLIGVFITGTSKKLLVPSNIYPHELKELEKLTDVIVLETKYNALGNNIVIGKEAIAVNPNLEEEVKKTLAKEFQKPVYDLTIRKHKIIGSLMIEFNKRVLVGNIAKEEDIKKIKEIFRAERVNVGSVNFGSPFIRSGLVLNSKGYIIGDRTTGHEIALIEETFY